MPAEELTVALTHPVTGAMFNATEHDVRAAVADTEEFLAAKRAELRPVYRQLDLMREWLAEHSTYKVPRRRDQTDTQRRIERCPRCHSRLEEVTR